MPHTHPKDNNHHPFDAHPIRPAPCTVKTKSRYLTPVQQQRIISWRSTTGSSIAATSPKAKSAPSSLSISAAASEASCRQCGKACSCSSNSGSIPLKSPKSPTSAKRYYKKSKASIKSGGLPSSPGYGQRAERMDLLQAEDIEYPQSPKSPVYTAYTAQCPQQYQPIPFVPVPDREVAAPKEPPRIRGSRDPITQQ